MVNVCNANSFILLCRGVAANKSGIGRKDDLVKKVLLMYDGVRRNNLLDFGKVEFTYTYKVPIARNAKF